MLELDISKFYIIGHRGMEIEAVENSLTAFIRAIELNLDFAECDIQISRDGVPMVFHDSKLEKKTGLIGRIKDHSMANIQNTDITTTAGQDKIPTLEELLKTAQYSKMKLIIELKTKNNFDEIQKLIEKFNMGNRVIVDSFNLLHLIRFRKTRPNFAISWLVPSSRVFTLRLFQRILILFVKQLNFVSLSFNINSIDRWLVNRCHLCGLGIFAYGVKPNMDYNNIIDLNINGFTAPDPQRVIEILKQRS